jgi:GMP synthase (glutamine-hydrolysing)
MPRILVFNGTPQAAESRLVEAGSRTYDTLIREAFDRHLADRAKIDYFTLRIADGERLPQGLGIVDFDGVWISGSPFNAYRLDQRSVQAQIDLVREIWEKGVPALGSCWGLQLMTVALGGTVHLNPRGREVGVARRINQTSEGRAYVMHHDKAPTFEALCVHEDEVAALPPFGTVLASNDVSRVQAAVMTDGDRCFWGVQYHPEFDLATIAAIIATRMEIHLREGLASSEEDVAAIVADYRALATDPLRRDLASKHGVGADILDPGQRTLEFRNWLETQVLPFAAQR